MHIAAEVGDKRLVEFFIGEGLNVNSQTVCRETPLSLAIKNGYVEIVELLLKSNADYMIKDNRNCNLIHLAVKNNQVEICKQLLSLNIDISQIDNDGFSALHIAAANNSIDLIKLLIDHAAYVDKLDFDDYTPLHVAASNKNNGEAVEALLKLNAKIDLLTFNGDLPLHRAAASGNEKGVMLLYRRELISWRNKSGYTPKMLAEQHGRISIVYLLKNLETGNFATNGIDIKKRVTFSSIPVFKRDRASSIPNNTVIH